MPEHRLQLDSPFLAEMRALKFCPLQSAGEAWLLLAQTLEGLREELDKPALERTTLKIRDHLVVLGGVAWMAAVDLGIESKEAAVTQDIPF